MKSDRVESGPRAGAIAALLVALCGVAGSVWGDPGADRATVSALDVRYQAAVAANDAAGMDAILADDFVLVTGIGKTYAKKDLPEAARGRTGGYERQGEIPRTQTG